MPYLQRLNARPTQENLSGGDQHHLSQHFNPFGGGVLIDGEEIPWEAIEEVEVARAPGVTGPMAGLVRLFAHNGQETYHVALYYGFREAVLHNISLDIARYVVQTVAYYASRPVHYTGPDGLSPTTAD